MQQAGHAGDAGDSGDRYCKSMGQRLLSRKEAASVGLLNISTELVESRVIHHGRLLYGLAF